MSAQSHLAWSTLTPLAKLLTLAKTSQITQASKATYPTKNPETSKTTLYSSVLATLLLTSLAGWQETRSGFAAEPTEVGGYSQPDRLQVFGTQRVSARQLIAALQSDPEILWAGHPHEVMSQYRDVIRRRAETALQHQGLPDARVKTRLDTEAEQIHLDVTEGPQLLAGRIKITGTPAELTRRLTAELLAPRPVATIPALDLRLVEQPASNASTSKITVWLDRDLQPVSTTAPTWIEGQPAPCDQPSRTILREQMEQALARAGYDQAKFNLDLVRDSRRRTMDLTVVVTDLGTTATIEALRVTGAQRNSPAEILDYLKLKVGQATTSRELRDCENKLRSSGRFLRQSITARRNPDSSAMAVTIDVTEYALATPLSQPLTREEQALLACRSWLLRLREHGYDLHYQQLPVGSNAAASTAGTDTAPDAASTITEPSWPSLQEIVLSRSGVYVRLAGGPASNPDHTSVSRPRQTLQAIVTSERSGLVLTDTAKPAAVESFWLDQISNSRVTVALQFTFSPLSATAGVAAVPTAPSAQSPSAQSPSAQSPSAQSPSAPAATAPVAATSAVSPSVASASPTKPFSVSLGLAVTNQSAADIVPLMTLDLRADPIFFLALAHEYAPQFRWSDSELTITTSRSSLRIDAASGRLLDWTLYDEQRSSPGSPSTSVTRAADTKILQVGATSSSPVISARITTQPNAFATRLATLQEAQAVNQYDPERPLTSAARFLGSPLMIALVTGRTRSSDMALAHSTAGATERDLLADLLLALRDWSDGDRLAAADDWMRSWLASRQDTSATSPLEIPLSAEARSKQNLQSILAVYLLQLGERLFERQTWPATLSRMGASYLADELKFVAYDGLQLYQSTQIGPVGCLAISAFAPNAVVATRFAQRGAERLTTGDFRRDAQLMVQLLQRLNSLDATAHAMRALTLTQAQTMLRRIITNERAAELLVDYLKSVTADQDAATIVTKALDILWENGLKQEIAEALRARDPQEAQRPRRTN
jgi:hypothetical protein